MKINISIVAYKTDKQEVLALVNTCTKVKDVDSVFLVDNSPTDELRVVSDVSNNIKYIHNPSNPGFGAAHNIAMNETIKAQIPYHLIVNPDIHFDENIVDELIAYLLKNDDIGVIMPQILYPNGDVQHLCKLLPTPMDLFGRRFIPWNRDKRNSIYEMHWSGYDKIMEAPTLSGCFTCFNMSVLKQVGLFDDRYFMYLEDFDLFRRIGEIARCVFYPKVSVVHDYGKGSYSNPKLLKYHIISACKYFDKWGWFWDSKRKKVNQKALQQFE